MFLVISFASAENYPCVPHAVSTQKGLAIHSSEPGHNQATNKR